MKVPKYAWLDGRCAMRLQGRGYYWRVAGAWGVGYRIKGDKIVVKSNSKETKHLDGLEFTKCSKEEWENDNEGYL